MGRIKKQQFGVGFAGNGFGDPGTGQFFVKNIFNLVFFDPLDKVDLIDLDVQGAELRILTAAADELNSKVKRIHIGTHNTVIEAGLRSFFSHMGWKCLNDYFYQQECSTPYGIIKFDDGVQTWINLDLK